MKSENEVRAEIEAAKRTLKNYQNAYDRGEITQSSLDYQSIDCGATIDALRWVLGENDRYD